MSPFPVVDAMIKNPEYWRVGERDSHVFFQECKHFLDAFLQSSDPIDDYDAVVDVVCTTMLHKIQAIPALEHMDPEMFLEQARIGVSQSIDDGILSHMYNEGLMEGNQVTDKGKQFAAEFGLYMEYYMTAPLQ